MPERMPAIGMERKLTAIFSMDVVGYSRLMGEDEEATIRTLTAYREVISSLIKQYRGRVVDSPGDNLLAEFASVVDAVRCAVEIQEQLKTKNTELPEPRQMRFRIGINLGDVIVEGDRLYGDGVNIAARLESLAEPGGICISGTVYDQVETKLALTYDYQGEQTVKNIAKPVRVYRLRLDEPFRSQSLRPQSTTRRAGKARQTWLLGIVVSLALLAGTGGVVWYVFHPPLDTQPFTLNSTTEAASPLLPLPDKPSIAVLPFTNMSGDPEQEYFSDGMTDDLITDLSKISSLFVIARNSVFTYKGKVVKAQDVGREMGVRYVLEGSVQKSNQQVRINTQLVDATTGHQIWAERYDREFKDIFSLQDEITQAITRSLRVEVLEAEQARVRRIPTNNLTAYGTCLRGMEYFWRYTRENTVLARKLFEQAVELDPQYAEAYAWLGANYISEWFFGNFDPLMLERAREFTQHALTLEDSLPIAHSIRGVVYQYQTKQYEQAIAEGERAITLDPNLASAYVMLADTLNWAGRSVEAIELVKQAMRLNPRYGADYPSALGIAYNLVGQYDEAIVAMQETLRLNPDDPFASTWLAGSYLRKWIGQWSQDPQMLKQAKEASQKSVTQGAPMFWDHGTLSLVYLWQKKYEDAITEAKRSLLLTPHDAQSQAYMGNVLNFEGRPEETLKDMAQIRCSTAHFFPAFCFSVLGNAYALTGRYEKAIDVYKQALTSKPLWFLGLEAHLGLAASYSELGRDKEARAEVAEVLRINPQFSLEVWQQRVPYKDPDVIERIVSALRKAGLK